MNWYKKDTRPQLLLAHGGQDGRPFAQLLMHALPGAEVAITLLPSDGAQDFAPGPGQDIVCTDLASSLAFAHVKDAVCVFAQSPYAEIEALDAPMAEKKARFLALHNSLSKARRVLALSEACRVDIQQYHSKHVYLSHLPATRCEAIPGQDAAGIAVIADEAGPGDWSGLLASLQRFAPVLYLTPSGKRRALDAPGVRLPPAGLVPVRPLVQIYLGADHSECPPLRLIDASAAGAAVIQVGLEGMGRERGRWMPTDCVGYFQLERHAPDTAELDAFIAHMLDNRMFFDSILSAQRRYLPTFQSNQTTFFELLTK